MRDFTQELTEVLCDVLRHSMKWNSVGVDDWVRKEGETLAEMYARFGKGDEVPEAPELPEFLEYLLEWFGQLSMRRLPAMSGISPITFTDIANWKMLLNVPVTECEVRVLLAMDDAYRTGAVENRQKREQKDADAPARRPHGYR